VIERARLGSLSEAVDAAVASLAEQRAAQRMWDGDHTLWQDDPTEVADRLGWIHVVAEMVEAAESGELDAIAEAAVADGLRHVVLLGMGGSSLFPEVLGRTFGARDDRLDLRVLDSTDPAAVARVADELDLATCLFVVASKSGTTIETRSQLDHFWEATGGDGRRFLAITDPGSELASLGRQRGFRAVIENRSDIGGRYSALSYFGMVPAALLGVDVADLALRGGGGLTATHPSQPDEDNPGVRLAAVLGAAAKAGRDKLTIVLPPEVGSFGLWLEQLVAESTGKHGTGILPVVDEPLGAPDVYGSDRLFVAFGEAAADPRLDALAEAGHPVVDLALHEPADLGTHVVVWETAVALSGVVLGINPFDQPDVAAAKSATGKVLAEGLPEIDPVPLDTLLDQVTAGDHVVLQAFVDPGDLALLFALESSRVALRDRLQVATSVGVGPRFLHSTGQLHKGGPPNGVFVQVVGDDPRDVPIPGRDYGFATLKQAQAAGDLAALKEKGLRAGRVRLDELLAVGR
jgi:transaldolase / glucose-6-phosphate isomerase